MGNKNNMGDKVFYWMLLVVDGLVYLAVFGIGVVVWRLW